MGENKKLVWEVDIIDDSDRKNIKHTTDYIEATDRGQAYIEAKKKYPHVDFNTYSISPVHGK